MASPRWTKLLRDVAAERGRVALMVAAIAVSLAGVGAVLGGGAVLRREMAAGYGGTRPAAAVLELPGGVGTEAVSLARRLPEVADAEAREVIVARARVGGEWRRLLLFVVDDFADVRLNRFRLERGAWPPPDGAMLVERSALGMLAADVGDRVRVKTAHGDEADVAVAGVVHDPGLAPGWQERSGYGYLTRATLARLGEPPVLGELRVALAGEPRDAGAVEAAAAEVAQRLGEAGHPVAGLRVPPPGQHPHQRQMETVLAMMLAFAGLALVLSAVLVASALAALLSRQVREIAVMKTLGATAGQVARLYAALVGAMGAAAAVVAIPAGAHGARALAQAVARLLNLTLASEAIPHWVLAVQAAAGIAVPLAIAAVPIGRASRRSVREAMDDHGVPAAGPRRWTAGLPIPLRSALRRPGRLALTVTLLAAGAAMALTADQVRRGWEATVARGFAVRHYDAEVLLADPAPPALVARVAAVPGIRAVEGWGWAPAAFAVPGRIDVSRTYPDRGHGTLVAMGVPPETALVRLPLKAGRWLTPEDRGGDAVVLNHGALALAPGGLRVGDPVDLSVGGRVSRWRLVGVVEEIGAQGVAYVADGAWGRAAGGADGPPPSRAGPPAAAGTATAVRLLRVSTAARTPEERAGILREVDAALEQAQAPVQSVLPLTELRSAMGDHILVLVRTLQALAVVLGTVGLLGLVSALGVAVVERTRELAILRTLGATPGQIARRLLAEALVVASLGYAAGLALSVPLTLLVGAVVGRLGFLAPLPLVLSPGAALAALAVTAAGTFLATVVPARRAAALSIRDALGRV